jgi:hypothetical protein
MTRSSEEVWSLMVEQAAEDAAWRQAIDDVAALSDEQLDAELRGMELDPAELEREAIALFIRPRSEPEGKLVGQDVFQRPAAASKRRRPVAVALWLAAAAVGTVGAGGLLYTLLHQPPSPQVPPPPEPTPPPPVDSALPIATMTPAQLRALAKAALDDHRPADCLKLLDDAKRGDPAGDVTPETKALRQRALIALEAKTDKPQP